MDSDTPEYTRRLLHPSELPERGPCEQTEGSGDVREQAVKLFKSADLLLARGEIDQALRLYREEVMPLFAQCQDARELLICRTKIAIAYLARGSAEDRRQAVAYLTQALADAKRLGIPEVRTIEALLAKANTPPAAPKTGNGFMERLRRFLRKGGGG